MSDTEWDDEQWVIDRLVEAVHGGKATDALAERLMRGMVEDDWWQRWVSTADGVLLPFDVIEDPNSHDRVEVCDLLERSEIVAAARVEELAVDDELTPEEEELWRTAFAECQFDGGGEQDMWAVRRWTHSDGRTAFTAERVFARIGEADPSTVLGAFPTAEQGLDCVKAEGYVSLEDFKTRREQPGSSV